MSLCRLECPICQQNLVRPSNENEPDEEDTDLNSVRSSDISRRHRTSWSWSPVSTPCGHLFHKGCLLEWFRVRRHNEGFSRLRGSCPTCRKIATYHNLVRVYLTPLTSEPSSDANISNEISPGSSVASTSLSSTSASSSTSRRVHSDRQDGSELELDLDRSPSLSSSGRSRTLNNLFNLSSGLRRSQHDLMRLRTRLLSRTTRQNSSSPVATNATGDGDNNTSYLDIACDNPDCIDLRNTFHILIRECRSLKRRLDLEIDVSKMKSILVASQQRDITDLQRRGKGFPWEYVDIIGLGVLVGLWVIIVTYVVFHILPNEQHQ